MHTIIHGAEAHLERLFQHRPNKRQPLTVQGNIILRYAMPAMDVAMWIQ